MELIQACVSVPESCSYGDTLEVTDKRGIRYYGFLHYATPYGTMISLKKCKILGGPFIKNTYKFKGILNVKKVVHCRKVLFEKRPKYAVAKKFNKIEVLAQIQESEKAD